MIDWSCPKRTRLVTVIAATVISLACGSNYVYSAWAPQFAARLRLSATESNLIGTFGNLGMYATGIPGGILIDRKGPRWGVAVGIVLFGAGYYPMAHAYDAGPGSYGVSSLCLFSWFTGAGGCTAFAAAIKAAALNYPESRGTATAFPLAAFGLSAFFFATVALVFPHDTYHFLLVLATGTVIMPTASIAFLQVVPHHKYYHLSQNENRALHRPKSWDPRRLLTRTSATEAEAERGAASAKNSRPPSTDANEPETESSSLLSSSSSSDSQDIAEMGTSREIPVSELDVPGHSHIDVRGLALLYRPDFWLLFCMLGLMTGVGLMTINNMGNDTQALWRHYDSNASGAWIAKNQVLHVSIISVCSFSGRLISGIGSDLLVSRWDRSRFWCLFVSAVFFTAAQLAAIRLENPHFLFLVSGLTGVGYGMLFGVYPTLVAQTFGVHGLSQNWGTVTLAPVISGNVFNILYGQIYDSNSVVEDSGNRECVLGNRCYRDAYWVTLGAAVTALGLCLWSIHHENEGHKRQMREKRRSSNGSDYQRI